MVASMIFLVQYLELSNVGIIDWSWPIDHSIESIHERSFFRIFSFIFFLLAKSFSFANIQISVSNGTNLGKRHK